MNHNCHCLRQWFFNLLLDMGSVFICHKNVLEHNVQYTHAPVLRFCRCVFQVLGSAGNRPPDVVTGEADGSWYDITGRLQQPDRPPSLHLLSALLQHLSGRVSLSLKALSSPFVSSNPINNNVRLRHPSSLAFHLSGQFLLFNSIVCMLQLVHGTGSSVTVGWPAFVSLDA